MCNHQKVCLPPHNVTWALPERNLKVFEMLAPKTGCTNNRGCYMVEGEAVIERRHPARAADQDRA
jgi:hypothetical protein